MSRRLAVAGVVAALLVAGTVAFLTGVGPAPGSDASGSDVGSFPTATPASPDEGAASSTGVADTTAAPGTATTTPTPIPRPSFAFTIERVEECGSTCRDVTTTLRNEGDAEATGVVVYTRVFVGKGTDGDVVWTGRERVGTLAVGASHTATRRVELSFSEGLAIQRADGWITVQTTVQSDQRTVTYTDPRDVA